MITEDQKKKYEEAAKEYSSRLPYQNELMREAAELDFVAGSSYTHQIAHSDGRNEVLDEIEAEMIKRSSIGVIAIDHQKFLELIQKLRK